MLGKTWSRRTKFLIFIKLRIQLEAPGHTHTSQGEDKRGHPGSPGRTIHLNRLAHPVLTSLSTSWPQNNAEGSSSCLARVAKIFKHQNLQNRFYTDISARVAKNVNFQGHFRLIRQSCEMSGYFTQIKIFKPDFTRPYSSYPWHFETLDSTWKQHGSNMEATWKRCKSCNCI